MSISLEGRVAIVTGAANGIGRAIANAFAAARARVILADILVEDGKRTQKEITDAGGEALLFGPMSQRRTTSKTWSPLPAAPLVPLIYW